MTASSWGTGTSAGVIFHFLNANSSTCFSIVKNRGNKQARPSHGSEDLTADAAVIGECLGLRSEQMQKGRL